MNSLSIIVIIIISGSLAHTKLKTYMHTQNTIKRRFFVLYALIILIFISLLSINITPLKFLFSSSKIRHLINKIGLQKASCLFLLLGLLCFSWHNRSCLTYSSWFVISGRNISPNWILTWVKYDVTAYLRSTERLNMTGGGPRVVSMTALALSEDDKQVTLLSYLPTNLWKG